MPSHDARPLGRRSLIGLLATSALPCAFADPSPHPKAPMSDTAPPLTARQLAIGPIAAATATGDIARLNTALAAGLDAGLSVGDAREILVQLYAYAGFPRALNALGALMTLVEERRGRGVKDAPGREPGPVPEGRALLALGTANQTTLSGAPVAGPLFEFAPAIDRFLKAHLFGDIFGRDNLDWASRELATVAALSALAGVESQLLSHLRISLNVGLAPAQLAGYARSLEAAGEREAAGRLQAGLARLAAPSKA